MNCQICKLPYNTQNRKPIELPCGHIFCFKCIYSLKKNTDTEFLICPNDSK